MVRWRLRSPWSCSKPICGPERNAVSQTFEFLGTDGGVRSWVILFFPQTGIARSKTGEADDTISLDSKRCVWMGPVFERLQRRQPQDKPLLNLIYAEYLLLFRRRELASRHGRRSGDSVDRAEDLRTLESMQKRGRWKSAKSARRYEKSGRVNQSWSELAPLVQALQSPPFGFASWPCLPDTTSTASSFVVGLFSSVFLDQRCTVRETRSVF